MDVILPIMNQFSEIETCVEVRELEGFLQSHPEGQERLSGVSQGAFVLQRAVLLILLCRNTRVWVCRALL